MRAYLDRVETWISLFGYVVPVELGVLHVLSCNLLGLPAAYTAAVDGRQKQT